MTRCYDLAGGPGDPFHIPARRIAASARFQGLLLRPGDVIALQPGPAATWPRRLAKRLLRAWRGRFTPLQGEAPTTIPGWAGARLVRDGDAVTLTELLYRDYRAWMTARGRAAWPRRPFLGELEALGVDLAGVHAAGVRLAEPRA